MIVDDRTIGRLEASAARTALDLVASLNSLPDAARAAGCEGWGGALIAMGAGRYVNRGVGVTIAELADSDLDDIEGYFESFALRPQLELSSWAPEATVARLANRSYVPVWFRSVFAAPVMSDVPYRMSIVVRPVDLTDHETWVSVFVAGTAALHPPTGSLGGEVGATEGSGSSLGDGPTIAAEFARAMLATDSTHALLAYVDGKVAGCAAVQIVGDFAWLGSAVTLPEFRGQGVQAALVAHRLRLARRIGCLTGAATAATASVSARNLARLGFQQTHTQVVVERRSR